MRLLLDTHILLWAIVDDPKLPPQARDLITTRSNVVCFSSASIWEVSIKHLAHPDKMLVSGACLADYCSAAGYEEIPVSLHHVRALETLARSKDAPAHNDPFDRIMLAQAKCDGLKLITHDALIPAYGEPCILFV